MAVVKTSLHIEWYLGTKPSLKVLFAWSIRRKYSVKLYRKPIFKNGMNLICCPYGYLLPPMTCWDGCKFE